MAEGSNVILAKRGICARDCHHKNTKLFSTGTKKYSRYCREHTCGFLWNCGKHKHKRDKYCEMLGCDEKVTDLQPSMWPQWVCQSHRCRMESCLNKALPEMTLCDMHSRRFANSAYMKNKKALEEIRHGCGVSDCTLTRLAGSEYCRVHKCSIVTCGKKVHKSGRCNEHKPCRYDHCNGYVQVGPGDKITCTRGHMICKEGGCAEWIRQSHDYCTSHRCIADDCEFRGNSEAGRFNGFCSMHTCSIKGCASMAINAERDSEHRYCDAHTCARGYCHRGVVNGGRFCDHHDDRLGYDHGPEALAMVDAFLSRRMGHHRIF